MNVQGVERVADFVGHAGRQQRQGMNALALDGFKRLLPRLGGVVQNQGHAGAALGVAVQRRGVKPQEARARIGHLKLVAVDPLPPSAVEGRGGSSQSNSGKKRVIGWPSTVSAAPIQQARDRLVEINDAAMLIDHQHPVLDGIEERLQKIAFPRQPLHDGLQPFGIEPADAAQHLVQKIGLCGRHIYY